MLEGLGYKIRRLAHQLAHEMFMGRERREKLQAELSRLLHMRDRYKEHQEKIAAEKQAQLKDKAE